MQTYRFDPDTREYKYAEKAVLDPLESKVQGEKVYLLPANSTFMAPPAPKKGYAVVWNGTEWEYIEDHRQSRNESGNIVEGSGTPYWLPDDTWESPARYMSNIGPLPKNAIMAQPEKPLQLVKAEAISKIDAYTQSDILAGFDYLMDGEVLHFSYQYEDQQNFSDTFNGVAMRVLMGITELPDAIEWNGWRNHTGDYKGDMVRFVLDVDAFLSLYTRGALAHKSYHMGIHGERKKAIEACNTVEEINQLFTEWGNN